MRVAMPVLALVCVLGLLAALVGGCGHESASRGATQTGPAPSSEPQIQGQAAAGRAAADFSFTSLQGKPVKLGDFSGKPLVVNFWASWCPYCVQEAPDLQALYDKYRGQGLQVVGIAGSDTEEALKAKVKELKLTYPVGISEAAGSAYGVQGIPHTFFITKDGKIASEAVGLRPKDQLEAEIKKIL